MCAREKTWDFLWLIPHCCCWLNLKRKTEIREIDWIESREEEEEKTILTDIDDAEYDGDENENNFLCWIGMAQFRALTYNNSIHWIFFFNSIFHFKFNERLTEPDKLIKIKRIFYFLFVFKSFVWTSKRCTKWSWE